MPNETNLLIKQNLHASGRGTTQGAREIPIVPFEAPKSEPNLKSAYIFPPSTGSQSGERPNATPKQAPPVPTTALQQACIDLNAAIDAFWMDSLRGLALTEMGSNHVAAITDAQATCRKALEAEGAICESQGGGSL